jgi:hypothetical protein
VPIERAQALSGGIHNGITAWSSTTPHGGEKRRGIVIPRRSHQIDAGDGMVSKPRSSLSFGVTTVPLVPMRCRVVRILRLDSPLGQHLDRSQVTGHQSAVSQQAAKHLHATRLAEVLTLDEARRSHDHAAPPVSATLKSCRVAAGSARSTAGPSRHASRLAGVLPLDEARRMAVNFAKLPELVQRKE